MNFVRSLLGGFFMGAADLVPGVSGGTIALVLGIYERLVASIRDASSALGAIVRLRFGDSVSNLRRVEWGLLIPLLMGIGGAIVLLSSVIHTQLEENPTTVAGAFLGLVVGSVVIAWRLLKDPKEWHIFVTMTVGVAMFVILGVGESSVVADPSLLIFFGSGAIAICAMILPGISGSLILLLLGMYQPVLDAVNDRSWTTIVAFGAGAIIGLALFSQILKRALDSYHDPVVAALIGLMVGSLRVLWPWPEGVDSPVLGAPGDDWLTVTGAAVVGAVVVYVIAQIGSARRS